MYDFARSAILNIEESMATATCKNLTDFLTIAARQTDRKATRKAAIIFVSLDRALDRLIQIGQGMGDYHRGIPSPWSHVFLLADDFVDESTPIIECSVRTKENKIIWDDGNPPLNLLEVIKDLITENVNSGICKGAVGDYNDPHIINVGIKWLPILNESERQAIVDYAGSESWKGTKYDFPGLFRELVRLSSGAAIPGNGDLLFCSAFVQKVYQDVLHNSGTFNRVIVAEDCTPDDIWYSAVGVQLGPMKFAPEKALLPHAAAGTVMSLSAGIQSPTSPILRGVDQNKDELIAALDANISYAKSQITETQLTPSAAAIFNRKGIRATADDGKLAKLNNLLDDAHNELKKPAFKKNISSTGFVHTENMNLALFLSTMRPTLSNATYLPYDSIRGISPIGKYHKLDPGWLETIADRIFRRKADFISYSSFQDFKIKMTDGPVTIGIAGDWGTGLPTSKNIAKFMAARKPDYTIHLGDVYYAGSEEEERENFLSAWPEGTAGSFALNSNHDMYAGGHGYFDVTLKHSIFNKLQKASFFCLYNACWQIIGLDSAYYADQVDPMYLKGFVSDDQLKWLAEILKEGRDNKRQTVLLTHHSPVSIDGDGDPALLNQITEVFGKNGVNKFHWLWGHEHGGAAFADISINGVVLTGRCIGHGGIPYTPSQDAQSDKVLWTETEEANVDSDKGRAKNGYYFLTLSCNPSGLEEKFIDEFDKHRWSV
jgi:hypothetical protein